MNPLQIISGQVIGYIRVSTSDQRTERQLDGWQLDRVFTEKVSAKDANRPQLQACVEYCRDGDTLVVHSLDRFARNIVDLRQLVQTLVDKGVTVKFVKENLTFSKHKTNSIFDQLLFNLLGSFAEFERNLIRERQREGIQIAKTLGRFKGRKRELDDEQIAQLKSRIALGVPKALLAKEFGVSRQSIYRYLQAA